MSGIPNLDRHSDRREETGREILDAAWEIARREGLSAVTLREVAGRIGRRSPPLYSHFDSKNAIYDAMFAQAWGKLCDVVDAAPPPPEAPRRAMAKNGSRNSASRAVTSISVSEPTGVSELGRNSWRSASTSTPHP
jgi:AcrR family transcriptional regulator